MDDDCPHAKPGELFYFFTRRHGCWECKLEQHEAWVQGVKQRLDEALFHLAHGLAPVSLAGPPCAKYPHCDQILGGGWPELPPGYEVVGSSDPMWTPDLINWYVGEPPKELCPGCGRPWADVPVGHAFTFADGEWRCRDTEPISVEDFTARTRRT